MCVVALAWNAHPRWRLVLAGNRDEFHARPAAPLARWDTQKHIIAGRDLQAGGSWLGVSEVGRVAVVTNVRGADGYDPSLQSRGRLISDFLAGEGRYAALDTADLQSFNAFNLIVATPENAHILTNRPASARSWLDPGIHGLSNGETDTPWPRREALESAMRDWIASGAADPLTLLDALGSDAPLGAGVPPIFIRAPQYGTRCSTIIAIDAKGAGRITERRYVESGQTVGEDTLCFSWV